MAKVLVEFGEAVTSTDGKNYTARACGSEMADGKWQGWVEFLPLGEGEPVRSGRETTQPNLADTEYWATGLTYVYLEGALHRALDPLKRPTAKTSAPPHFDGPAVHPSRKGETPESVLDPFSIYRKGEPLLRAQLSAMAGWHLVNIIRRYELSEEDPALLAARDPADLVEMIIDAVRAPRRVSQ